MPTSSFTANKLIANKVYSFDLFKVDPLFDELLAKKAIELKHKLPKSKEIKVRQYCKWHNVWSHPTINCVIFRDFVEEAISTKIFIIGKKAQNMMIYHNPLPAPKVNMVNLN